PTSFITRAAAAKVGVNITDPAVTPIGKGRGLDGSFDAWVGLFPSVKIGDEEIRNAPLEIGETAADDYDVLIGADFFQSHHVYVSHIQNQISFAYEGGPAFQAQALVRSNKSPGATGAPPAAGSAASR